MRDAKRLLLVEDSANDAELIALALSGLELRITIERVTTEDAFLASVAGNPPELILSDFSLPSFDALRVLEIVGDQQLSSPVIIVTGTLTDESAVQCIKHGAVDCLLKENLHRLPAAVERALAEKALAAERKMAFEELHASEDRYRLLFDACPLPMWVFDLETLGFLAVNKAAIIHYGYSLEDFGK